MSDPPYPELKKAHTMAHTGRPWTDRKPPPSGPVWGVIQGLGSYHVLLAAVELGVFDALGDRGPSTSGVLADRLGVSAPHLGSLLDALVALGLLDQFGNCYELNETAERYLTSTGAASMADLVAVATGPLGNWAALAETVRAGRPADPIDDDPAAFYVPLVEGTFTTMLRTATRADLKVGYSRVGTRRVLDLGAGAAPWAIAVLTACPDARAVVNDLPEVLEVARRRAAELGVADRCEFRPGDFHHVDLEEGHFDLVVLSHVCRTEGEQGARQLIGRAFGALRPGGRVLFGDYFVDPGRKFNPHGVLMGMTMRANTVDGFGITNDEATSWLAEAGFSGIRLIEPIGFQFVYVATRPDSASGRG